MNTDASADDFRRLWADLNARYFRGALPPIDIQWSERLTASAGLFVSRRGPRSRSLDSAGEGTRRMIRLSRPLLAGRPPQELIETLAHEMIHQWQYDLLKRWPDHGAEFRRKMREMAAGGLRVTIRHDLHEAVRTMTRYRWQCAACGQTYERQRRTIQPRRHRCGACRGRLTALSDVPRSTRHAAAEPARKGFVPTGCQIVLPF